MTIRPCRQRSTGHVVALVAAFTASLLLVANALAGEAGYSWKEMDDARPPYGESCGDPRDVLKGYHAPPPYFVELGGEGRRIWPLRHAARLGPKTSLALSAAAFALARRPAAVLPGPASTTSPTTRDLLAGGLKALPPREGAEGRRALGRAFADLAVSGRRAYAAYKTGAPTEAALVALATPLLKGAGASPADITQGAREALARAKQVADYFALVIPTPDRRKPLGWIAVSGEDDPPHRPCNIPSLPYPQYNIDVPVSARGGAVNVNTRFAVINANPRATAQPTIPKGDVVLLFIHGDSSRIEEVTHLIKPLLAAGQRGGISYTILAMDLPSHGYTTMVDPHGPHFKGLPNWPNTAPRPPKRPPSYTILEFLDRFVVGFVAALDKKTGVARQIVGPMGGSLGGNMSLRLARLNHPWLKQSCAWSAASVWDSMADDLIKQAGPNTCSSEAHRPEGVKTRKEFFFKQFDETHDILFIKLMSPQGEYWYRNDWPCKKAMLAAARLERAEFYNRIFRQWHWAMDWEQLIYSYNDKEGGQPRHQSFRARLLLGSGSVDNYKFSNIYDASHTLARNIARSKARGRTFFVENTGHSIQDERPALLAAQIDAFTAETLGCAREWIRASGRPLVRFTGDRHEWTKAFQPAGADAGKLVLQLTLTVRTGGDDLRAGSKPGDNADAIIKLRSGRALTFSNINRGKRWGNNTTHHVQLFIPASLVVKAEDLASFTLRTQFGGGIGGDNWNVDDVLLTGVVSAKKSTLPSTAASEYVREWLNASGKPLVRFTGSRHEWYGAVKAGPADAGKPVRRLAVTIHTGGDDLRGGKKPRDNADLVVKLRSGKTIRLTNINMGKRWGNGSVNTVTVPLPAGATLRSGDVTGLTLRTDFGGGVSGDNWNVDRIVLRATLPAKR